MWIDAISVSLVSFPVVFMTRSFSLLRFRDLAVAVQLSVIIEKVRLLWLNGMGD